MSAAQHEGGQRLWALFTATPQLDDIEQRRAQREAAKKHRCARWQAECRIEVLYLEALTAAAQGRVAMIGWDTMDRAVRGAAQCFAALQMIDLIDHYLSIPFASGKRDKTEAGRLLRRWQRAVSGCQPACDRWREREPHWLAKIGGAK